MSRLRKFFDRKDETGAGALLPIIVVGMIIVAVSASTAAAVSFSSKISSAQIKQLNTSSDTRSILSSFQSDLFSSTAGTGTASPKSTATVNGGSYKVYYSTAPAAPTSTSTTGVTALPTTGVPTGTKWLLVVSTPTGGNASTSVYSYIPRGSAVHDNVINWTGSATYSSVASKPLQAAKGVVGPVSIVGRESSSSATTQKLSVGGSTAISAADIYASYSTARTTITGGTVRGSIVSKAGITYSNAPVIYGHVTQGGTPSGSATIAGTQSNSATSLPAAPGQAAGKMSTLTTRATLTASDCSTAAQLKAKIESITSDGVIKGIENCASGSWTTTVTPKANLVLESSSTTSTFTMTNFQISGGKSLSFNSPYGFNLNYLRYNDGATGQILSGGNVTITNSLLNGAVANYGTSGGTLSISSTTMYYSPVAANLCSNNTSTTTCTAISSTVLHLVRVS